MHKYAEMIQEAAELKTLERKYRNSVVSKRLEMLRKLKPGEARSLPVVARQINDSLRHCQRWFKSYQEAGLKALLKASEQASQV